MSFFSSLKDFGQNTAVIDKYGENYSYSKLDEDCEAFSNSLGSSRKLVFLLAGNNYDTLVGYLGTLRSNSVCLLLNSKINPVLLDTLIETYKPDVIYRPDHENRNKYILESFEVERASEMHPDLKLLIPTSGTTGSSKLVKLSARNIESNAEAIVKYLELGEDERAITPIPLFYVYGLSVINSHLKAGACILLTDDNIILKSFWDFFKNYKATSLVGVPYNFETYKQLKIFEMGLGSLRYMTQAGGKMSEDMVRYFAQELNKIDGKLYVMYGQTEAAPRISYLPPEKCLLKSGSIGIPVPGGNLYISDSSGRLVDKPYFTGELIYEGPNVMMGYATKPEDLEKPDMMKGVLRTGDLGYMDEDGYFFIQGRLNRFIKIAGHRIGLDEVENYIKAQGIDCVAGGREDCLLIGTTDRSSIQVIEKLIWETYKLNRSVYKAVAIEEILRGDNGKPLYEKIFASLTA